MMSKISNNLMYLLAFMLLLIALYPLYGEMLFADKATFFLQKLTTILILSIFAMSLDLLVGVCGLVSLGHALYFGVAGYSLALFAPEYESASLFWLLPASLAISGLVALVVGILSVRTSGVYFIMVTLAFGQMGFYLMNDSDFSGGSDGLYIMFKPVVEIAGWQLFDLDDRQSFFYFTLACLVLVFLLLKMLIRSPFGRVLVGIHSNEHRVQAIGFNTSIYKVVCFVIAGVLAGLAGFLSAVQYGFVNPSLLDWHSSGHALMMVIMGGSGTIFGAILGAFTFEILHYVFESFTEHWLLLMGAVTIAVVLLLPQGLAGALISLSEKLSKSKTEVNVKNEQDNKINPSVQEPGHD